MLLRAGTNFINGKTFVDTNVLIYPHDVDAKSKHPIAKEVLRELWTTRTGVLSMQVLQEFYEARISFWDALIVAAAAKSGATRILSEDLNPGQKIAGLRIENPFAPVP